VHQGDFRVCSERACHPVFASEGALADPLDHHLHLINFSWSNREQMFSRAMTKRHHPIIIFKPISPLETEMPDEVFVKIVSVMINISEEHDACRITLAESNFY